MRGRDNPIDRLTVHDPSLPMEEVGSNVAGGPDAEIDRDRADLIRSEVDDDRSFVGYVSMVKGDVRGAADGRLDLRRKHLLFANGYRYRIVARLASRLLPHAWCYRTRCQHN